MLVGRVGVSEVYCSTAVLDGLYHVKIPTVFCSKNELLQYVPSRRDLLSLAMLL